MIGGGSCFPGTETKKIIIKPSSRSAKSHPLNWTVSLMLRRIIDQVSSHPAPPCAILADRCSCSNTADDLVHIDIDRVKLTCSFVELFGELSQTLAHFLP